MGTAKAETKPAPAPGAQELQTIDYAGGQLAVGMEEFMTGASDFDQKDISIPFIKILQSNSPQLLEADPKYIEEAKMGMILENVTPEVISGKEDAGIYVIPVFYERSYTEWKPNRGGFVADHGSDDSILKSVKRVEDSDGKRHLVFESGNELAENALYYVFWSKSIEGPWNQALLSMGGTQWKTARDWNANMSRVVIRNAEGQRLSNPLPFACIYHFSTVAMKKDNNNFFGWKVEQKGYTLAQKDGLVLIQACCDFRKLAMEGRVSGIQDDGETETSEETATGAKQPF